MSIKLGITGGIGSGKSVVSRVMELMGIPVYIADDASKRLTVEDQEIRRRLIGLLGEDIYENQTLNKAKLAGFLFSSPQNAQLINQIIHPRVKDDFRRWASKQSGKEIIGIEAAILFEAGFEREVDYSIMVYAPKSLRIARASNRDNCPEEAIERRIKQQMDDEQKLKLADFTVYNDDTHAIIPQIEEIIGTIKAKSKP